MVGHKLLVMQLTYSFVSKEAVDSPKHTYNWVKIRRHDRMQPTPVNCPACSQWLGTNDKSWRRRMVSIHVCHARIDRPCRQAECCHLKNWLLNPAGATERDNAGYNWAELAPISHRHASCAPLIRDAPIGGG